MKLRSRNRTRLRPAFIRGPAIRAGAATLPPAVGGRVPSTTREVTMKKMKLELEALNVESFETAAVGKRAGTVHGAAQTEWYTCPGYGETCNGGETCWDSCAGTCRCVTFADSCGDVSCIDTCVMSCG